jgi:hypothetical protein
MIDHPGLWATVEARKPFGLVRFARVSARAIMGK